jgi:hypothetical protein
MAAAQFRAEYFLIGDTLERVLAVFDFLFVGRK